jgi:hypothetical protein
MLSPKQTMARRASAAAGGGGGGGAGTAAGGGVELGAVVSHLPKPNRNARVTIKQILRI